jgi:hypothetical protein
MRLRDIGQIGRRNVGGRYDRDVRRRRIDDVGHTFPARARFRWLRMFEHMVRRCNGLAVHAISTAC